MIGTKSRISFRQYIKNKPKKWGVKVFILADSANGYILNLEVCTKKRDIPDDKGATYHTVMRLLENHLSQGYCVFMDNCYSSPTLYTDLLAKGTGAVGACICDSKYFPKSQLNSSKLKKVESLLRNELLCPVIKSPLIPERLLGNHFIYRSESHGRCRVCGGKYKTGPKKGRKDTKHKCEVHLCIESCFMKFHTRVDFLH